MPLTVADLETLEQYLAGVMNRSGHHQKQSVPSRWHC
jgi:hypothetical protein